MRSRGRRMARPDADRRRHVVGLLLEHPLEEARDAVGAQAELLEQLHAGGVGVALEGAAVAQRQQQAAACADGSEVGEAAGHRLEQLLDAELPRQALDRVIVHDVAHLVRQHAGHLVAVARRRSIRSE